MSVCISVGCVVGFVVWWFFCDEFGVGNGLFGVVCLFVCVCGYWCCGNGSRGWGGLSV